MTFAEKISKILDANTLQIHSVSQLEDYIKAGRSAIGAHVAKNAKPNSAPGRATQKRIIEKLRINPDWWNTGKGEIYLQSAKEVFNETVENDVTKRELFDRLYKDLDNQARHLDKALDLVARLLPPNNSVERFTAKDR